MKKAQKVPSPAEKAAVFAQFLTNINHSYGRQSMNLMAQLNESFKNSFVSCSESLYKNEIMMQMTHEMMIAEDVHEYIFQLRVFVSKSYNVRGQYECEMTNITNRWKFEMILDFLEQVSAYDLTDVKNLNDIA